ncbi:MAG: flagellar motor switch protein FliG [Nitrospirota bacterium]
MAGRALKGYEKAAVFLAAMGEEAAAQVLKKLDEPEIDVISGAFGRMKKITKEQVDEVMVEFHKKADGENDFQVADESFLKKAVEKALGTEKARETMERISSGTFGGMEIVKRLDHKTLANFLKTEHPQTLALIMSGIEPEQASQIIPLLPEAVQPEVLLRMATIEGVPPAVFREVEEVLRQNFQDTYVSSERAAGGLEPVANVLNLVDKATEQRVMEYIEANNSTLAEKIRRLMFVFDDLGAVDDRSIQALLKEITTDDLGIALKTAGEEVKQAFIRNMSQKASQILLEEMEAKGPMRRSDVEKVQQNIIKIARNLEAEGKIILGKGGEEVAY